MAQPINVVISSTFRDLAEYRKVAANAVQRLGMIPLMADSLGASADTPIEATLKLVDDADIYLGIFGFRYGYIPDDPKLNPDHVSITELEYRRAVERKIDRLLFIMSDDVPVRRDDIEGGEGGEKLKRLKDEMLRIYVVGFFSSPDDLHLKVVQSLEAWTKSRSQVSPNPTPRTKRARTPSREQMAKADETLSESPSALGSSSASTGTPPPSSPPDQSVPPSEDESEVVPSTPRRIASQGGATNDRPADQDQLEFQRYADAFADLIASRYTKPPITIGIFGSWGAGKSFLLKSITKGIERRQGVWGQQDCNRPSRLFILRWGNYCGCWFKLRVRRLGEWGQRTSWRLGRASDWIIGSSKTGERKEYVNKVYVLNFNAWEYNSTQVIWAGLVRKIMDNLERKFILGSLERRWQRVRFNMNKQWRMSRGLVFGHVLLLFLMTMVVAGIVYMLSPNNPALLAATVVSFVGLSGLLTAIYSVLTSPLSKWVTKLFQEGDYGNYIDYMVDIREDLDFLQRRLKSAHKRVLIIIDDLDRCEPTKAVEVLQAINLLLNFDNFIVILGIDARIITAAINKYYSNLLEGVGASGYEYLDKIIQIPFRIPEPSPQEVESFLFKQMGEPQRETQSPSSTSIPGGVEPTSPTNTPQSTGGAQIGVAASSEQATHTPTESIDQAFDRNEYDNLEEFSELLRANPRHLKRLLNVYRLVRTLLLNSREHNRVVAENSFELMGWLVMSSQWSYTTYAMIECWKELVDKNGESKVETTCADQDPLTWLYNKTKSLLDSDLCNKLDDDPDKLDQLLVKLRTRMPEQSSAQKWLLLKVFKRYTINFNPAVEGINFIAEGKVKLEEDTPVQVLPFS